MKVTQFLIVADIYNVNRMDNIVNSFNYTKITLILDAFIIRSVSSVEIYKKKGLKGNNGLHSINAGIEIKGDNTDNRNFV